MEIMGIALFCILGVVAIISLFNGGSGSSSAPIDAKKEAIKRDMNADFSE